MKLILGDNQFFGVNHFDLNKGELTKNKFSTTDLIESFINEALRLGMDGFMMNSNELGYKLFDRGEIFEGDQVHYSIPYPHKYANMVNENGMTSLFSYLLSNSSVFEVTKSGIKFLLSQNLKSIVPAALDLEIPKNLPKDSYVYLQNILTDLLIGLGREDILIAFIESVLSSGFKPGIITLNPCLFHDFLNDYGLLREKWITEMIVCFNINHTGFNVFPSLKNVENLIYSRPEYKMMGMSIFSSGGASIEESLNYVKAMPLDYIVFGSSKLENIKSNIDFFKL